jgi:hypothetical protein
MRQHGLNPRYVATQQTQPTRLLELAALLLQTQMQAFLAQVAFLCQQLVCTHLDDFFDLHLPLRRSDVVPQFCHVERSRDISYYNERFFDCVEFILSESHGLRFASLRMTTTFHESLGGGDMMPR